jgi:hypothetical protein
MTLPKFIHLTTLIDKFCSQLVLDCCILHDFLSQFFEDLAQVAATQVEKFGQLVLSALGLVVVLAKNLLLEQFNLAFVFDLLLLLSSLKTHNLLFLQLQTLFVFGQFFVLLLYSLL